MSSAVIPTLYKTEHDTLSGTVNLLLYDIIPFRVQIYKNILTLYPLGCIIYVL